ncbi:hypothetical protein KKG51_01815, partial [Patescibacteria group bacterium]|nr:hypothetical protein [Patescibacteria group bacterium]
MDMGNFNQNSQFAPRRNVYENGGEFPKAAELEKVIKPDESIEAVGALKEARGNYNKTYEEITSRLQAVIGDEDSPDYEQALAADLLNKLAKGFVPTESKDAQYIGSHEKALERGKFIVGALYEMTVLIESYKRDVSEKEKEKAEEKRAAMDKLVETHELTSTLTLDGNSDVDLGPLIGETGASIEAAIKDAASEKDLKTKLDEIQKDYEEKKAAILNPNIESAIATDASTLETIDTAAAVDTASSFQASKKEVAETKTLSAPTVFEEGLQKITASDTSTSELKAFAEKYLKGAQKIRDGFKLSDDTPENRQMLELYMGDLETKSKTELVSLGQSSEDPNELMKSLFSQEKTINENPDLPAFYQKAFSQMKASGKDGADKKAALILAHLADEAAKLEGREPSYLSHLKEQIEEAEYNNLLLLDGKPDHWAQDWDKVSEVEKMSDATNLPEESVKELALLNESKAKYEKKFAGLKGAENLTVRGRDINLRAPGGLQMEGMTSGTKVKIIAKDIHYVKTVDGKRYAPFVKVEDADGKQGWVALNLIKKGGGKGPGKKVGEKPSKGVGEEQPEDTEHAPIEDTKDVNGYPEKLTETQNRIQQILDEAV